MSYSTHLDLKQLHEQIDELTTKITGLRFWGNGPNDMIPVIVSQRNIAVATNDINFKVMISAVSLTVNKMNWSEDGGTSWRGQNIVITGEEQLLNYGVAVKFIRQYRHVLNDYWTFTVEAANSDDERATAYNWVNDRLEPHITTPVSSPSETLVMAEACFAVSIILRYKGLDLAESFRSEATRLIDEFLAPQLKPVGTVQGVS